MLIVGIHVYMLTVQHLLHHRFANHWSRSLSCSKYEVALRTRINRVVTQYRDVVYAWDVFQEVHDCGFCGVGSIMALNSHAPFSACPPSVIALEEQRPHYYLQLLVRACGWLLVRHEKPMLT